MNGLVRSLQRLAPSFTLAQTSLSDGSPALEIRSGATLIALAAIQPRSFSGFNIVGDISSSAGEGTPESVAKLYVDTDASGATRSVEALLFSLVAKVGCSATELYEGTAAPAEAALIPSNLQQTLAGSAEMGFTGA